MGNGKWGGWKQTNDTAINHHKTEDQVLISRADKKGRDADHIHCWDNHPEGHAHHNKDYEVGERLSSIKGEPGSGSSNLFGNFVKFLKGDV